MFIVEVNDDKTSKEIRTLKIPQVGSSLNDSYSHYAKDVYVEVGRRLGPRVPFVLVKTSTVDARKKDKWDADEVAWTIRPGSYGTPVLVCPMRVIPPGPPATRLTTFILTNPRTGPYWVRGKWWPGDKSGKCPSRPY